MLFALVVGLLAQACAGDRLESDHGQDGGPAPADGAVAGDGGWATNDGWVAPDGALTADSGTTLVTPEHLVIIGWDGVQRDHFRQCLDKKLAACPRGLPSFAALTQGKLFHLTVTTAATCNTTPKEPSCKVKANLDHFETDLQDNANVGQRALTLLDKYKGQHILAFFHFWDPDHTGHQKGERSGAYTKALVDEDAWLGKIVARLKAHGIYDKTLIYVVTDHGFDEGQTSHLNAPYGIYGTNDPLATRHGDRKDPTPTILKRFGLKPGALEGVPLDSVPTGCVAEGNAALDYPGAPTCCAGLTRIGLGRVSSKDATCLPATGGAGDKTGHCTQCGDGACVAPENRCNCKADCKS